MSYQTVNPNSNLALWQASGIGSYQSVGDYGWEFFPAPFDFEAPKDSQPIRPPVLGGTRGMGCGCGCGGGCAKNTGLGQGLFNTGLFTSTNPLQWGWGEWTTVGVGLYLAGSLISDVSAKTGSAKRALRKHKGTASFGAGSLLGLAAAGGVAYVVYNASQTPATTTSTTTSTAAPAAGVTSTP